MITPDFEFEKSLLPSNCRFLLGIDEVGRGPWAGPVTIGAFLLDLKTFSPDEFIKLKVRDSKKLSTTQRQQINKYFKANNFDFKTFSASSLEIDQQGIAVCLQNLIKSALQTYRAIFDFCLIDGNFKVDSPSTTSVIKGDQQCFSIASASIVAKVDRDQVMDQFDLEFPVYGFKNHKGYGTAQHLEALKTHGPCEIHRKSYKPISALF